VDIRVCFFGDSFTAGVGDDQALGWVGRVVAQARADGMGLTAYNLGVRRETGPEIARRIEGEAAPRLRDGDAFGVVFSFGVNDTTTTGGEQRVAPVASRSALAAVADLCLACGWALLVVGPAPVADEAHNERISALTAALASDCASRELPFVDVASLLTNDRPWLDELASGDGAHPGGTGYMTLARLIQPHFADWLTSIGPRR
jgi:acyl-CoA thioesterase-1